MDINYLKTFVKEATAKRPDLREQINDYYELVLSEIEEGGSTSNEVSLAINSINELLNE